MLRALPPTLLWLPLLLTGCDKTTPGVAPAGTPDPHVLILVVDGVRVEEFTSAFASDLTGESGESYAADIWEALGEEAMIARGAFNLALPSTSPAHATIVTGAHQPVMTVGLHVEDPGVYRPLLPTIFEEARAQNGWGEEEARLLANAVVMPNSTFSIAPGDGAGAAWEMVTDFGDDDSPAEEDVKVIRRIKELIEGGPPHVMLANLHNADRVAHSGDAPGYLDKVRAQSRDIAAFYRWLEDNHPDYLWQLQLVVVADHGRHRHDLEGGWSGHGDSCDGCREIPLFVLGGGVDPGVVGGTFALQDLAPTLAAHLGIDMPWADGLPFGPGADRARQGLAHLSASGTLEAATRYRQDLETRSEVIAYQAGADPEALSSPGATLAEAPLALQIADGDAAGDLVCFRELVIDPEEDWWPWRPRCLHRSPGGAWRDIGFPDDNVGPFWRPGLSEKDGELRAFWLHTPLSRDIEGDTDQIRWATWTPDGGWSDAEGENVDFISTETVIAHTRRGAVAAVTTNDGAPNNAYTRRIEIHAFDDTEDTPVATTRFNLGDILTGNRRVEWPALRADGDAVQLAMIGVDEDQRGVFYARSEDGGETWGGEGWISRDGLYVHLPPAWDGEWLTWAEQPGDPRTDDAQLCRARSADEIPTCLPVGSPRLQSFSVQGGTVRAVVDQAVADWEIVTLQF